MIKIICTLPEKERLIRSLVFSEYCPIAGLAGDCIQNNTNAYSCPKCIEHSIEWLTPDSINFPNSEV